VGEDEEEGDEDGDDLDLGAAEPAKVVREVELGDAKAGDGADAGHPTRPCIDLALLSGGKDIDEEGAIGGLDGVDAKIDEVDAEDGEPDRERRMLCARLTSRSQCAAWLGRTTWPPGEAKMLATSLAQPKMSRAKAHMTPPPMMKGLRRPRESWQLSASEPVRCSIDFAYRSDELTHR
jgi:hypothetical protein